MTTAATPVALSEPRRTRDLAAELVSSIDAARRGAGADDFVAVSVVLPWPVPRMPRTATMAWVPRDAAPVYARGETAVIQATGPDRFAHVEGRARALFERVRGPGRPRLLGGFAFDGRDLEDTPWRELGEARFVLPRWQLECDESQATLTACVPASTDTTDLAELRRELAGWLEQTPAPTSPHLTSALTDTAGGGDDYRARVVDILAAIHRGDVEKIVAARHSQVQLAEALDAPAVMDRLSQHYPGCYRVAIAAGSSVLIGAPPELLVRRRGAEVWSEALAGSIARDRPGAAAELLASRKDRNEQNLVVRAIDGVLRPLCEELDVPEGPHVQELRHLLHLRTPIHGRLRGPHHVVDLVARLHPTPAVGGTPGPVARRWIADHEDPRGWYAAPVGWFDRDGNGEFAVAIRSALVQGRIAHVLAGAGIVDGSNPDLELAETELKQRAMLDALGVSL